MPDNDKLLQKADWALSDIVSNGGYLNPEQTDKFIRKLYKGEPTILNDMRIVDMMSPKKEINKIGFNSRILRAGIEGTALTENYTAATAGTGRSKPTTEKITLIVDEYLADVPITYDIMEEAIERVDPIGGETNRNGGSDVMGGIRDTVMDLIAGRVAIDLEELILLGDTSLSASDAYLATQDGAIKIAEDSGNVLDVANASISKTVIKAAMQAMPDQYLRNRRDLIHYFSTDNHIELEDTIASRQTAVGDAALQSDRPVRLFGSECKAAVWMPETKGLYTNPKNLVMGVLREISMEVDKDIRAREYQIVVSMKIAFEIEEPDAIVVYNNIGSA